MFADKKYEAIIMLRISIPPKYIVLIIIVSVYFTHRGRCYLLRGHEQNYIYSPNDFRINIFQCKFQVHYSNRDVNFTVELSPDIYSVLLL